MWLVVGLGNPGSEYARTRHNAGFMAVDALADAYGFSTPSKKFKGLWCEGSIDNEKVCLLKPQTFMNLSGESVGEASRFYKIPLERIVVIHDEIDLPLGEVKIKHAGGAAGHNGLKSIDAHIGKDYLRVRVGIGKSGDAASHVLDNFSREEAKDMETVIHFLTKNLFTQIHEFYRIGARNLKIDILPKSNTAVSADKVK